MFDGPSVERHHWIPKSEGGRDIGPLHTICHRMVHRVLTDGELAESYATPDALRAHPEIRKFIRWVRKRPPEYTDWPERPGRWGRNAKARK